VAGSRRAQGVSARHRNGFRKRPPEQDSARSDASEREKSDELTADDCAVVEPQGVLVPSAPRREIEIAARRFALSASTWASQSEPGLSCAKAGAKPLIICVGPIVILKAIIRGSRLSGDPQFIDAWRRLWDREP